MHRTNSPRRIVLSIGIALIFCVSVFAPVHADPKGDAETLKNEALEILKKNSNGQATVQEYATCIFKLEKAQALLDGVNDTDSALAQEVSSSLFWARRFSNIDVINTLDKMRGGGGAPIKVNKPATPKPPEPKKPDDDDDAPKDASQAAFVASKAAYEAAQKYCEANANDDYQVALRWFQMAAEHPGTDYALKALDFARAAQARFAAKKAPATTEQLPDTDEMNLVKQADALVAEGKFEQALPLYRESIKKKETSIAHRKLGQALFKRAQQLKDDFLPKHEAWVKEYNEAIKGAVVIRQTVRGTMKKFNPNHPPYVAAMKKRDELVKQGQESVKYYDQAESAYKSILRIEKKDLDAAGHVGLCLAVRTVTHSRARSYLAQFLSEYKPVNDIERSLYEFCKSELDRLKAGK